ncbi:MAG: hypothetical protein WEA79_01735 [Balneolaceae bacterium]
MGAYLGVSRSNGVLGDGLGESRTKKRAKRDHYLGLLYNMGLNRGVTMNHSDHWAVARDLYTLAQQLGQPVITAANEFFGPGNMKLYSAKAQQVPKIEKKARQIIKKQEEEERKAREAEEKKRKEQEEKERKKREKEEEERLKREEEERKQREKEEKERQQAEEQASGGSGSSEELIEASLNPIQNGMNPLVIGGAALGTGVLILMLLRG